MGCGNQGGRHATRMLTSKVDVDQVTVLHVGQGEGVYAGLLFKPWTWYALSECHLQ